jgi:peptidyl-prolyl cis-trans isomerase SurA
LAVLDAGEASSTLRRGGWRVFLMLCSRGASPELLPSRDQVQEQLLNQRLGAKADIYLEELRSEAVIVEQ